MSDHDLLVQLCREAMDKNTFTGNKIYEDRLNEELTEIKKLNEATYFVRVHQRGIKANSNENNSLVPYLLGICEAPEMDESASYTDPEFPDIDVDFLPKLRDYLKNEWTPKRFGKEYVCNICNYNTFGLKSSLIDIARVLGKDRDEIIALTTKLGLKDDEGDPLGWDYLEDQFADLSKARDLYKELARYKKDNEEVWDVAKHIVSAQLPDGIWKDKFGYGNAPHRKRGMGLHASGLIISGVPLDGLVPMVVPSGSRDKGLQASAWVEGLADTDLSSMGFIKMDYLALEANAKIAECNKRIIQRHGLKSICALPGGTTWSDLGYLDDPVSLKMATKGDLKGIFQFDSDGIRKLVKACGVNSFDDLAAITALYRPGPMDVGMHEEYINRKHGKKAYAIPDFADKLLKQWLITTYGVLVYQEEVMLYLSSVGKIPISQCTGVIKAISKKRKEKFLKYQEEFIKNAQITLGIDKKAAEQEWANIESWGGYGFNASHSTAYTYISSRQLYQKSHFPIEFYVEDLAHLKTGDDRIAEYIRDARKHDIKVNRLHLNRSGVNFDIVDIAGTRDKIASEGDEIYYGFGKVKGIGEEAAKRIVSHQPYAGFHDFLHRFGTDAKTVQALIALRVFDEDDPINLFKFYEVYKNKSKKETDRRRRFEKSIARYTALLREIIELPTRKMRDEGSPWLTFSDEDFSKLRPYVDVGTWKQLEALKRKYVKCISTFEEKSKTQEEIGMAVNTDGVKVAADFRDILKDKQKAEKVYYGFEWDHPLDLIPGVFRMTWEDLRLEATTTPKIIPVEMVIRDVFQKEASTGTMIWKVKGEDCNKEIGWITVWDNDYQRFEEELIKDNCVRMRIKVDKAKPPFDGYWYTMESPPRHERWRVAKEKKDDPRLVVLKRVDKGEEFAKEIAELL